MGVVTDNAVKWKHIGDITVKLPRMTGVIYKVIGNLNLDNLKQIYLSLVYRRLLYCEAMWGGAYQSTTLQNLFKTQKKVFGAILF